MATAPVPEGPRRTCIGCRRVRAPGEMVRIRRADDALVVGPGPGRGVWLCRDRRNCVDDAEGRRAFERGLRGAVTAGAINALRAQLAERASMEA